jgi:hypothetical protein
VKPATPLKTSCYSKLQKVKLLGLIAFVALQLHIKEVAKPSTSYPGSRLAFEVHLGDAAVFGTCG